MSSPQRGGRSFNNGRRGGSYRGKGRFQRGGGRGRRGGNRRRGGGSAGNYASYSGGAMVKVDPATGKAESPPKETPKTDNLEDLDDEEWKAKKKAMPKDTRKKT